MHACGWPPPHTHLAVSSAMARRDAASDTSLNLSAPKPMTIRARSARRGSSRAATAARLTASSTGSPRPSSSPAISESEPPSNTRMASTRCSRTSWEYRLQGGSDGRATAVNDTPKTRLQL